MQILDQFDKADASLWQKVLDAVTLINKGEEKTLSEIRNLAYSPDAEIRKAAYEAEKERGYEEGLAQGRMEIAEKKLEMLDSSVAYMESVEGRMADIVMKALHKCVEEIGDRELVVQVVRKVMSAVIRTQKQVTLKVAPGMGPVVKERLSQILAAYPTVEHLDVVEDDRLHGPACMIETEAGVADGSVDSQLAAIERSIKKHFSKAE